MHTVATAKGVDDALSILRTNEGVFDLVLSDAYMHSMNGAQLQTVVEQDFRIPCILMAAEEKEKIVEELGLDENTQIIVKPPKIGQLKNLWEYVISREKGKNGEKSRKRKSSSGDNNDGGDDDDDDLNCYKKPKLIWTTALHNKFLDAIRAIGFNRAVPKKIMEYMNVPGLTRENIASHLQKYRIYLRRICEASVSAESGIPENWNQRPFRSSFTWSQFPTLASNSFLLNYSSAFKMNQSNQEARVSSSPNNIAAAATTTTHQVGNNNIHMNLMRPTEENRAPHYFGASSSSSSQGNNIAPTTTHQVGNNNNHMNMTRPTDNSRAPYLGASSSSSQGGTRSILNTGYTRPMFKKSIFSPLRNKALATLAERYLTSSFMSSAPPTILESSMPNAPTNGNTQGDSANTDQAKASDQTPQVAVTQGELSGPSHTLGAGDMGQTSGEPIVLAPPHQEVGIEVNNENNEITHAEGSVLDRSFINGNNMMLGLSIDNLGGGIYHDEQPPSLNMSLNFSDPPPASIVTSAQVNQPSSIGMANNMPNFVEPPPSTYHMMSTMYNMPNNVVSQSVGGGGGGVGAANNYMMSGFMGPQPHLGMSNYHQVVPPNRDMVTFSITCDQGVMPNNVNSTITAQSSMVAAGNHLGNAFASSSNAHHQGMQDFNFRAESSDQLQNWAVFPTNENNYTMDRLKDFADGLLSNNDPQTDDNNADELP